MRHRILMLAGLLLGCTSSGGEGDDPVAIIEGPDALEVGVEYTFSGVASYDPRNNAPSPPHGIAEYTWTLASQPSSSQLPTALGNADAIQFTADAVGEYGIRLEVADEEGARSGATELSRIADLAQIPPTGAMNVRVTWDADVVDVGIHLVNVTAGGEFFLAPFDCYYGNMTPDWGPVGAEGDPVMDADISGGYGPENIVIETPEAGPTTYRLIIHYYSDNALGGTTATASVFVDAAASPALQQSQFLSQTGRTWEVADIEWPSKSITVRGDLYDYSPF